MKKNKLFLLLILVSLVAIAYFSLQESQTGDNYLNEIELYRKEKNLQMLSEGFPFANNKESFTGLKYYDPDPAFRISASLSPIRNKKVVILPTNDELESRYLEYAYADFAIDGIKCRLLILEVLDQGPAKGTLFLAFADETSARETYGAGRYVDINKVPGSSSLLIDFNKAYNPYCAYSDSYSCPLPPRENVLNVAIRAGEKSYK